MTVLAGTGHTAFSTLPVIAEVAKEQGIRPSRPLSIAVIASQLRLQRLQFLQRWYSFLLN